MGATTEIAWTDHTFNPWWGCQRVSPGCEHCYAESFSKRVGLKVWGPQTERRFFGAKHWAEPLKWNKAAERDGVRRRVFCASMADVFEDRPDLEAPRHDLWDLILSTPHLDWQLLTKRPENVARMTAHWPTLPRNIWVGTTAENQEYYDKRWGHFTGIHALTTFVSYEPALGPLVLNCGGCGNDYGAHMAPDRGGCSGLFPDWVIVGGESGNGARPFNPTWAKDILRQCEGTGIAVFVKQLGANVLDFAGVVKDRKGGDMAEWPEDLRMRAFPPPPARTPGDST